MNTSDASLEEYRHRMVRYFKIIEELARYFSEERQQEITTDSVRNALFERLCEQENLVGAFDLTRLNLVYDDCILVLKNFDFTQFDIELEVKETDLPLGILPDTYASIKNGGKVWRIHLNDVDPWPSKPHAHLLGTNRKLNLSNGDMYAGQRLSGKVPRKELIDIRTKFEQLKAYRGTMPPLIV